MTSNELRQAFLDYFSDRGHQVVASSPLVPGNDPTLLFTNAGMVQFKDVFLGEDQRNYRRAVSSQRCVRAGGKHNDLENVGYTARHHTFFEMLGNFSFGDYFKEDAIRMAWGFLTETLGLPAERLWVTVFETDDEAADIWLNTMKIDPARFTRMGEKDNFWAMGETGPCGPCSEIFYDHGPDVAGGPPGSADEDGDRFVEIWNLVFMQFDRSGDGELHALPKPSVDTGMGLERVAAVMQQVHSNYDIDLFRALIDATARVLGVSNDGASSLNVIADHIRACSFLIVDGVLPGNEGRGYVLRRIIRRAVRHGKKLGMDDAFFFRLVEPLCEQMAGAYPELASGREHVERVLKKEELRFAETLSQGLDILESAMSGLSGTVLPGDVAFKLYDTYGFPVDLTADIVRERGLSVDSEGFETAMEQQRKRARAASKFAAAEDGGIDTDIRSAFSGYEGLEETSQIEALFMSGKPADRLSEGDEGAIVLASTPFYGESGGQVGDTGSITSQSGEFQVSDTQKRRNAIVHLGRVTRGTIKVGNEARASVDGERRHAIALNHSATHLLHAALRAVLGEHVAQKGSLVAAERLRFDFSHYEAVSPAQIAEIEAFVNREIRANAAAETQLMHYADALESGAIALFGEKYDDEVRVLRIGGHSVELCGGTHVARTGDIGLFKITSEGGVASGVRRIEAMTGAAALHWIDRNLADLQAVAAALKSQPDEAEGKIAQLIQRNKSLEKELAETRAKLLTGGSGGNAPEAVEVQGIKVLVSRMDGADAPTLRDAVDRFKDSLKEAVVVLGAVDDGKVRLAAGVTRNQTDRIHAGELIRPIAAEVGGKGGGRADFAQAGGSKPDRLDAALAAVPDWVSDQLDSHKSVS